jgi:HK97 gp10 family phage protein
MAKQQDFDFNVQGLEQIDNLIKNLPKEVTEKIQQDIHKQAAKIVKKQLEDDAPDGVNDKSNDDKAASNVVIKSEGKSGVNIGFKKKVWYVKLIEMGTKVRNVGKKKGGKYKSGNRGKIDRKPFIEQSHETAAPVVVEFLQQNYLKLLNNAIKKQLRKVNKKK